LVEDKIYLDYAAATPVDPAVIEAMRPFWSDDFYNPSANYLAANSVRRKLDGARADVAEILGARPNEIIFTAGATEADNLAVQGVMRRFPGANVVVSAVEHEAILAVSEQFERKIAPVGLDGKVDLEKLGQLIDDKTVLVCVMYANNEIGTIEPLREIAKIINQTRSERQKSGNKLPIYLMSDAAQAANYLDLHVSRLGVDLMSLNGGKIYGPKQSGCLFVKSTVQLEPLIYGGGQERGVRSGTENVAQSVGFAKALRLVQGDRGSESRRLTDLQIYFWDRLARDFPGAVVNGSKKQRLPNNLHFTLPGIDNERLIYALDERGIAVAAGSACSASDETSSHVLLALGMSDEQARSSIRLSMGRSTTREQLDKFLAVLKSIL
jgi:cysteine desulfurase